MVHVLKETAVLHWNQVQHIIIVCGCRSWWPRACWDCGFESRRGAWKFVSCECCVLSSRDLCDELITRTEESNRVCVCLSVIVKPRHGQRHGPLQGVALRKKKSVGKMQNYCQRRWYIRTPKEAFAAAMQSWRERCEKCVCLQGDYVEKWLHFQLPVVSSFF